ncbi:MAG: ATP-binding cassette domain-containing protein [Chloroflexi bacterium]|nr:ATP-binding cassette domain-containing protein [Chloroflexota bacterium]
MEKRNDTVQTLSRGMQQKVALACALIAEPDVLLLDEPTLGLDFQSNQAIQNEIKRLTHERGKTILLTTHQMEIAQSLVDRVAIIDRGRIVALDRLRNLLDLFALGAYEIRVNGHLALERQTWLQRGWNVQTDYDGHITKLSVTLQTEHDLYNAIKMLQPYKLPILSVQRTELNLGEIYLKLIEEGKDETTHLST